LALVTEKEKALGRKIQNEDIDLINILCYQYINGEAKEKRYAQAQILEFFDGYLEKYVSLFLGAPIDLKNYDTRVFLGLFLSGRPKTFANFIHQRNYIVHSARGLTKEDLKAEFTLIFLTYLSRYTIHEGVDASNPLTKMFRFRLKDWFTKFVRDPLNKKVSFSDCQEDETYGDPMDFLIDMHSLTDEDPELIKTDFDLNWVMSPIETIYKRLTVYERYLLSLVYREGLSVVAIGERLQRDKDTIKRHLNSIHSKLQEYYNSGKERD